MPTKCDICNYVLSKTRGPGLHCAGTCGNSFHAQCVGITESDLKLLTLHSNEWKCTGCRKQTNRTSFVYLSDAATSQSDAADETVSLNSRDGISQGDTNESRSIGAIYGQIELMRMEFNNMMKQYNEKLDKANNTIKVQNETLTHYINKVEKLEIDLQAEAKKTKDIAKTQRMLEEKLNELEQYSKNYNLEIAGVPESTEEDVFQVIKKVADHLGVDCDKHNVQACHRLFKKKGSDIPPKLIVRFNNLETKRAILSKRKELRSNITSHDLGYGGRNNNIYLNTQLTRQNYLLLVEAKKLQKSGKLRFVWQDASGKIMIREEEGCPAKCLRNLQQLNCYQPAEGVLPNNPLLEKQS